MSWPARVGRASDVGAMIACAILGAHCFDFYAYKKLVTIFLSFIAYVDTVDRFHEYTVSVKFCNKKEMDTLFYNLEP